jgi:hypothetical protein
MTNTSIKVSYGLWLLIAAAVTAKILIKQDERSVYPVFAAASEHWWQGLSLYANYPDLDLYRYSPTFAVLFSPFTVDPVIGQVAWVLASYSLLFYAARLLFATYCQSNEKLGWFLVLIALGSVRSVWNGQSNILLIALIVIALVMITRQRWWLASGLLMAATFIKIWPLALCALLFVQFPKRLFLPLCIFAGTFLLLPFLTMTPSNVVDQYASWGQSLLANSGGRWPGFRDAWTIWEALGGSINQNYYHLVQVISGLATLALTFQLKGAPLKLKILYIFCLWLCWQLIFGPGTERATYSVLAPAFAIAAILDERRHVWLIYPSGTLFLLFSHGSMERLFLEWIPFADTFITAAAIIFLIWVLIHIRKPEVLKLSTA